MLILIDCSRWNNKILSFWGKSGFLKKIQATGCDYAIFDPSSNVRIPDIPALHSLSELFSKGYLEENAVFILLNAEQVFFLPSCIQKIMHVKIPFDYYTQWEHCRLPVGIGARAFSARSLKITGAVSPAKHLAFIVTHPELFKIIYDDEKFVSYDTSRYDCRLSEKLDEFLSATPLHNHIDFQNPETFFNYLQGNNHRTLPVYTTENYPKMMDERKIKAAYGFESEECAEFPTYIMFDLTNRCNSRCIHCPHSVAFGKKSKKTIYLDFAIYKKAIDECKGKKIQFVRLTADGEPLLHPLLFEMINYASKQGVGPVGLTTNGSLLTPERARLLAECGLFMVDISLDAIKKQTYEKIRRGLSFECTMENVLYLLDYKATIHSPLKVMVSFVKQGNNIGELEEFENFWKPRVDRVLVKEIISNVNLVPIDPPNKSANARRWPCPHWFRRIVINYEGVIKACPVDWENKTAYRNLSETSLYEAWHSDFYWKNRMQHLNGDFSPASACKNCEDWYGSPWNLGYEKVIKQMDIQG